MREPVFTDTLQIGIVVRDVEATMRRYVDDYGIGPWELYEFDSRDIKDFQEHGRAVESAWRLAATMIGHVQWELIQPLDGKSDYARFLAEKGEGVHHVAVAVADFDEAVSTHLERGEGPALSGELDGIRIAYLPTGGSLGVLTEIFSGSPGAEPQGSPSP